jgi:MFS family permease
VNPTPRTKLFLVLTTISACIATSLLLGQDSNWDLRNYHYYDGWAFASGTPDRDLWPAQQQSFANPILPTLVYLLIANLPPLFAVSVLATLQSANVVLLAIIAGQIFPPAAQGNRAIQRLLPPLAAILIGVTGPMMLAEWGTTFGDNLASSLVLGALAALGRYRREATWRWAVLAGLAAGCAAGIKLTNMVYIVGFAVSGWWLGAALRRIAVRLALFWGSALVGFALTFGPWAWHLWRTKANPVFPYFNGLFQSPWRLPDSLRDDRFLPHSLLDALSYPLQWVFGHGNTSEVGFRDTRFAIAWLLILAWLFLRPCLQRKATIHNDVRWLRTLTVFWVGSYWIWIVMFGIQRYLVPLELLSGLIIVGILVSLAEQRISNGALSVMIIAVMTLILATTRSDGWGRMPWGGSWFDVRLPPELQKQDEMFVIVSGDPVAYVIPFFPASARFVRLDGNLVLTKGTRLFAEAEAAIAAHQGPVVTLEPSTYARDDAALLARFGLRRDEEPCVLITTRVDRLSSCPLHRIAGAAAK